MEGISFPKGGRALARAARFILGAAIFAVIFWLDVGNALADVPKRAPQDYGRPKKGATPGEVLEWVPRVGLFPLWVTSEFLLRRPIGALIKVAEKEEWPEEFVSFFTFGDRRQITVYPSALFDFGLKPSVGFNASWKYFLADPNTIRLHFGTWGVDWLSVRAVDHYDFGHGHAAVVDASVVNRRDLPFFGIGPRSPSTPRYRYQAATAEIAVAYQDRFWRESIFEARMGVRSLAFGDGTCCGEIGVSEAVSEKRLPEPAGFHQGYTAAFQRLSIVVSSRKPRPAEGSGLRAEAHGEGVFAPDGNDAGRRAWVKYGGSIGAAVDLTEEQRVLSLTMTAELADPLLGAVPFVEQVSLGGESLMRGYLPNRLIDRSALVATLKYTWPIWVYLDGVIETDLGNVFGVRFADLEPGLFRLTSGIGVRSSGARDSGFEILVAAGTDPFERGFDITSFRLVIGSHHGF